LKRIGKLSVPVIVFFLFILPGVIKGQGANSGQVNANFQINAQTYSPDEGLGITDSILQGRKFRTNGYGDIRYRLGNFSAGLRFESYLPPLAGFDPEYEGVGIPYWFASYAGEKFELTAGNFYEQFGNGMILRSYQEWDLGYDNSIKGLRVKFNPVRGAYFTALAGVQRYYWQPYTKGDRGIIKAFDMQLELNEIFPGLRDKKTRVTLGGSFVSKFETAQKSETVTEHINDSTEVVKNYEYKIPSNVAAASGRLTLMRGGFSLNTEYVYKFSNPSAFNNYIYKAGDGLLLNLTYSQKGLGIFLGFKRIDNMSYKSRMTELGNVLDINFIPPFTKPHSYALTTIYPYATQLNGENTIQGQVTYTIPRKSKLGGKYGTKLEVNYSLVHGLDVTYSDPVLPETPVEEGGIDPPRGTSGYTSKWFSFGQRYFQDFNIKLEKKASRSVKLIFEYLNLTYNTEVIEGHIGDPIVHANIGIADVTWRIRPTKSLRFEYQHLFTDQDRGDWAMLLVEYSIAPKWFFSVQNQYNYGNPDDTMQLHYYTGNVAYVDGPHRISLGYGRQREGILCIGGICRQVPSALGFILTISSSF